MISLRALNLLVPYSYKNLVEVLSGTPRAAGGAGAAPACAKGDVLCVLFPWVAVYLAVFLLQGGAGSSTMGLLSNLRWVGDRGSSEGIPVGFICCRGFIFVDRPRPLHPVSESTIFGLWNLRYKVEGLRPTEKDLP